jgi:tetratricopeptide (TPR) repeat protein
MKKHIAFAVVAAFGLICLPALAARADDTATPAASAEHPWEKDQALLESTMAAIKTDGITAVAAHVAELEQALAGAKTTFYIDGTTYVLTDGAAEALIAMTMIASDKSGKSSKGVAVDNPYPGIALCLGSYYDEIGKSDEALRVLDAGLASSAVTGIEAGDHRPILLTERGAAFVALKRWPDALASYDEGLKIDDLDDGIHAHLLRGRGFALTELNRLDEAEAAYNESLKLDPGNERAMHELKYIAQLRAGAPPSPSSGLAPLQPQTAPAPSGAPPH